MILLFKHNILFKKSIISCCIIFFEQVFPTLFPMFILNDLLIEYNFVTYLSRFLQPIFYKLFHFSNAATYIFIMSILSGTPTNGYITANLVEKNQLNPKDASIILSYSFFLNPLFLYNMLLVIFKDSSIAIKLILITYAYNLIVAFLFRKYKYQNIVLKEKEQRNSFSKILKSSISHAFSTLTSVLGTMIFYFILCEGIQLFIKNGLSNCLINGLLEVTGGLAKLNNININLFTKEIIALMFISFGGLSIQSQIKSIILDVNISSKPLTITRCLSILIFASIIIIIS